MLTPDLTLWLLCNSATSYKRGKVAPPFFFFFLHNHVLNKLGPEVKVVDTFKVEGVTCISKVTLIVFVFLLTGPCTILEKASG